MFVFNYYVSSVSTDGTLNSLNCYFRYDIPIYFFGTFDGITIF